jgi:hypothetical protein
VRTPWRAFAGRQDRGAGGGLATASGSGQRVTNGCTGSRSGSWSAVLAASRAVRRPRRLHAGGEELEPLGQSRDPTWSRSSRRRGMSLPRAKRRPVTSLTRSRDRRWRSPRRHVAQTPTTAFAHRRRPTPHPVPCARPSDRPQPPRPRGLFGLTFGWRCRLGRGDRMELAARPADVSLPGLLQRCIPIRTQLIDALRWLVG